MGYYADLIKEKRNAKEVIQDGYRIIVKPEGNGYALRVLDERNHVVHERRHFSSESMALEEGKTKAKRDLQKKEWDELHSSKEKKGYYAKLAEEKAEKKNSSSGLHRAINLILSYLQDGWTEDKIKRELKSQYNVTDEDIRDGLIAAKRLNKHI